MTLTAPIFLSAFSRGGSNIVWNLLASHPKIVSPRMETHEVLFGKGPRFPKLRHFALDVRFGAPYIHPEKVDGHWFKNIGRLSPNTYGNRNINAAYRTYIARCFANILEMPTDGSLHLEKQPGKPYTAEEWRRCRVVFKSINGTLWLNRVFQEMYPDAVFINLTRDGLALTESRIRRSTYQSAAKFGAVYQRMTAEMKRQAETLPNVHILKFEDLLQDPVRFVENLFDIVGENLCEMPSIRLRAKGHYNAAGDYVRSEGSHVWLDRSKIFDHVNPEITQKQLEKLSDSDRAAFLDAAGSRTNKI